MCIRDRLITTTSVLLIIFAFELVGHFHLESERYSLLISFGILLFIFITVPEHFLVEHLWKHTIKKHIFKIFLWTFGVLLFLEIILPLFELTADNFAPIAEKYYFLILLFALLIGIIPNSGPHLVFVFLFSGGLIPLSILIANSIVQDGHGGLPLLAESRKSFFYAKGINIFVGLIIGIAGFLIGI